MSSPNSSKATGGEENNDGTPGKKMGRGKGTKRSPTLSVAFSLTYKEPDDDDASTFLVSRPQQKGRLIAMENVPEVWSVKSLAKIWSALTAIYNPNYCKTAEDTVKAVISAALVLSPHVINGSFSTTAQSKEYLSMKDNDQHKSEFSAFIARNALNDCKTSVKRFYLATTTGNWYPEHFEQCNVKERAKIVMTWLTSYIVIHAYGDRQEIQSEYGKLPFFRLLAICERHISNVVNHFRKFLHHSIRQVVFMDEDRFFSAKFLPTIRQLDFNIDELRLQDSDLLSDLKSQDVEAGEYMRALTKMVAEQSEISLRKKMAQLKELKECRHVLNRQAFMLNTLEGKSGVDQYQKRRYEDELMFINDLRTMYYEYRSKSSMPPSCSIRQFWDRIKSIILPVLKEDEDRPTASEEQYPSETIEIKVIKQVQLVTETIVLDPCELEEKLQAADKNSDENFDMRCKNISTQDDDIEMNSAEEESQNDVKSSPVAKKSKSVKRILDFDNESVGMMDPPAMTGNLPVNIVDASKSSMMNPGSLSVPCVSDDYEMRCSQDDPVNGSPASESSKSVSTPPANFEFSNPHQDLMVFQSRYEPPVDTNEYSNVDLSDDENMSDNLDEAIE